MSSIKIQKREGKVKVASKAAFVFNPRGESMPKKDRKNRVMVNRAPVLTLWEVVVAEVPGFDIPILSFILEHSTRRGVSLFLTPGTDGKISNDNQGRNR